MGGERDARGQSWEEREQGNGGAGRSGGKRKGKGCFLGICVPAS